MNQLLRDPATAWSAVMIVLLPLVIIGAGEVEERLRQSDSGMRRPVAIARTWVLPLFVVWFVVRAVIGLADNNLVVLVLGSALVVALAATLLTSLKVVVDRLTTGPRPGDRAPIPRLLLVLPRLGVILLSAWLLLSVVWNVDLSAALTALGVTSLVVSFALQDPLSSLASGFLLLSDQPFQPGDWIQFDELEGRVTDVNWRTTRIETRNGDMVVIPNGTLAGANVTNFDQPVHRHRLVVPVQVAYSNSPTNAKDMLLAAAHATPGVLDDPPPAALVVNVDDPLMGYVVHLWIDDYTRAPAITSDFGSLVWYHSHRRNVPLPSPAQDLYLHDGAAAAAADRPVRAEVLAQLRQSALLDQLDDEAVDALADVALPRRYARGEVIVAADADPDLFLLSAGHAALVLRGGQGDTPVVDFAEGDLFGLVDHPAIDGLLPVVVAVDDCDVLAIGPEVAGTVISRNPSLSSALDQMGASRRRRIRHVLRRLDLGAEGVPTSSDLVAPATTAAGSTGAATGFADVAAADAGFTGATSSDAHAGFTGATSTSTGAGTDPDLQGGSADVSAGADPDGTRDRRDR